MMLAARTKQYFAIALLVAVTAVLATVYLLVQIRGQGARLEANSIIINESAAQVDAAARSHRLMVETEQERLLLRQSFFREPSDSLDFLAQLETLAPQFNVKLTGIALDEVSDPAQPGKSEMRFRFGYSGGKTPVLDFTRLLEHLPYHSRLESVSFEESGEAVWEAQVEVRITIRAL